MKVLQDTRAAHCVVVRTRKSSGCRQSSEQLNGLLARTDILARSIDNLYPRSNGSII